MIDQGSRPLLRLPPGSCDAHFHIFEPPERFPQDPDAYHPPLTAPLHEYMAFARSVGLDRFVVVQPAAYGHDNSCLVEVLGRIGPTAGRAVVCVGDEWPDDTTLELWHSIGVRGVRVLSHQWTPVAGLADALKPRIALAVTLAQEMSWHVDFLSPGWLTQELLPVLFELPVQFTVAHLGLLPWQEGRLGPTWRALVDLVGDRRCWLKLTGLYRLGAAPVDVASFIGEVLGAAPDRVLWGSDFPHISFEDKVRTVESFGALVELVPDAAVRHRILVDNPAELYGF